MQHSKLEIINVVFPVKMVENISSVSTGLKGNVLENVCFRERGGV